MFVYSGQGTKESLIVLESSWNGDHTRNCPCLIYTHVLIEIQCRGRNQRTNQSMYRCPFRNAFIHIYCMCNAVSFPFIVTEGDFVLVGLIAMPNYITCAGGAAEGTIADDAN